MIIYHYKSECCTESCRSYPETESGSNTETEDQLDRDLSIDVGKTTEVELMQDLIQQRRGLKRRTTSTRPRRNRKQV